MDDALADANHENSVEEDMGYGYDIIASEDEVDFAFFAMHKYVMGELMQDDIASFDTVYRNYILWSAIFYDEAILQLPHPRRYGEGCMSSLERDPIFWEKYEEQVKKISNLLKRKPVEKDRIFISRTPYVVETRCGFYYSTKPKTYGIYFTPHTEIDPIVRAELEASRDTYYTQKRLTAEWESALEAAKSVPEFAPTTGTYNCGKRYDGRYDLLRVGKAN